MDSALACSPKSTTRISSSLMSCCQTSMDKRFARLIRGDPTMSDIKIICISGMIEADKIQELTESGADDFLHKPLDIDELMRRVCRLLDMEASVVS